MPNNVSTERKKAYNHGSLVYVSITMPHTIPASLAPAFKLYNMA